MISLYHKIFTWGITIMKKNTSAEHAGKARGRFSGGLGYVLAVAGSAVGLGNIWRFPYLAAKYGGGMFLLVYLILVVTFGYALIVTETALGRMTRKSPVGAFHAFGSSLPFQIGGWVNAVVPMLIVPYYCVIGGWVLKYLAEYLRGSSLKLAEDGYFTEFIASSVSVELWFLLFSALVFFVILAGVKHGIERVSRVMMPLLVLLAMFVAVYSVTRPGAWEGVKYFLVPKLEDFSFMTVIAAMGQMFYSLSIAMGILYTYGSYIGKDVDIEKSTAQVEFFDTAIALLAGMMVIPAVFVFSGGDMETLKAGPSLAFITLPRIFASMGMGGLVGIAFFLMFFFAALTSAISLMETSISTFEDELKWSRPRCCMLMVLVMLLVGSASSLGYGALDFVKIFGMAFLDFFDFLTNSVMMPVAAFSTCILVIRVAGFERIAGEVERSSAFRRKKLYCFFLKYVAPICIGIILISSIANVLGIISL